MIPDPPWESRAGSTVNWDTDSTLNRHGSVSIRADRCDDRTCWGKRLDDVHAQSGARERPGQAGPGDVASSRRPFPAATWYRASTASQRWARLVPGLAIGVRPPDDRMARRGHASRADEPVRRHDRDLRRRYEHEGRGHDHRRSDGRRGRRCHLARNTRRERVRSLERNCLWRELLIELVGHAGTQCGGSPRPPHRHDSLLLRTHRRPNGLHRQRQVPTHPA